ncbi:MAG: DNA repair protein RadC [Bacteroidales bacterium]|nr:DNA repair protein RadC [Bacteroidales bacterium]
MENSDRLSIKEWAEADRPREKMMLKGAGTLSDAELMAILIGSGNRRETAVELSRRILQSTDNNLNQLGKYQLNDLTKFSGIGEAKAITILAALELGRRRKLSEAMQRDQIEGSHSVYAIFHPILADIPYEEFWVLLLNQSNRVINRVKISQGGVAATVVDVKLILKSALIELSPAIILCHNHPSGNKIPSGNDDSLTEKIKRAAKEMDIRVLDHVIVCDGSYYSYADEGKL